MRLFISPRYCKLSLYEVVILLSSPIRASSFTNTNHKRFASSIAFQAQDQQFLPYSFQRQFSQMAPYDDNQTTITRALNDPIFHPKKHRWGFVIIRGTYNDNTAWQSAMTKISSMIPDSLQRVEQEQNVLSLYDQTVLEDPSAFTDTAKDSLRPHFTKWVHSDLASAIDTNVLRERHPEPILDMPSPPQITDKIMTEYILQSTRHSYFIYINSLCLKSFSTPDPVVILVQKDYETPGTPDFGDEHDPIESNPHYDVGWYYMALSCYVERYRALGNPIDEEWERSYERPPWVSDWYYHEQEVPFGPELNKDGTAPAWRGE